MNLEKIFANDVTDGFNFQNMQIIPFSNKDQTTQLIK